MGCFYYSGAEGGHEPEAEDLRFGGVQQRPELRAASIPDAGV